MLFRSVTQDSAGLAQKGGATWSHVLIADKQHDIRTTRVGMAGADLIFGCDPIVAAGKETLLRMREGRTHVALNSHSTPTAAFVKDRNWQNPAEACAAQIARAVGEGLGAFDAETLATRMMGDSLYVNPMILGYAWQRGWIPLGRESLLRAIELNEVAVQANQAAFEWGRHCAQDWEGVQALLQPAQVIEVHRPQKLGVLVERRAEFLRQYQHATYAQQYLDVVAQVQQNFPRFKDPTCLGQVLKA